MLNNKKNIKQTVSTALSIMFLSQSLGSAKAKESFAGNTIIPQNRKIVKNINKKNLSFKEKLAKYLLGIGVPIAVVAVILGIGIPLLKNKKPKQHQMNKDNGNNKKQNENNSSGNDGCDDNKEKDNKEKDNKEKDENSNNDSDDKENNKKQERQQRSNQNDFLEGILNQYYDEKEIIETNPSKFLVCLSGNREIDFGSDITTEPYIIGQKFDKDIKIENIKLKNLIKKYNIDKNDEAIRKILLGLADKINSDKLKKIAAKESDNYNYIKKGSGLEEWEKQIILEHSVKVCKLSVLQVIKLFEKVKCITFDKSVNFVYIYNKYDMNKIDDIAKTLPEFV